MVVKEIILHCSATVEGKPFAAADIKRWHLAKGWKDIGYHYVVDLDGKVEKGRADNVNGAHTVGHNSIALGICYIGGVDKNNKPKDTRTDEQKESLFELVYTLLDKYNLKTDNIHCHYEFANKACPSFKREEFIEEYITWLNDKLK